MEKKYIRALTLNTKIPAVRRDFVGDVWVHYVSYPFGTTSIVTESDSDPEGGIGQVSL